MSTVDINSFFKDFDSNFCITSVKSLLKTTPIVFNCTEVLVQSQLDLPIPMTSGSEVVVQFSTTNGDISFSMHFASSIASSEEDSSMDTMVESTRVSSDVTPYTNTFKATKDGTLLLIWDNSFSWFTSKYLTYTIELRQPTLQDIEKARCLKSRSMLSTTVLEIHRAEEKLSQSKSRMRELGSEVASLEERAAAMRADLAAKKKLLDKAYEEADEMSARIDANADKKMGLCIRYVLACDDSTFRVTLNGYHSLLPILTSHHTTSQMLKQTANDSCAELFGSGNNFKGV